MFERAGLYGVSYQREITHVEMSGYDIVVIDPAYVLILDKQDEDITTRFVKKQIRLSGSTMRGTILLPSASSKLEYYGIGSFVEINGKRIPFIDGVEQYILIGQTGEIFPIVDTATLNDAIHGYIKLPNNERENIMFREISNAFSSIKQ